MSKPFSYSKRWQPTGFSGGGGTECAAISPHDPNRIIMNCDMGCAYLSEDGGKSWNMYPWQQLLGCPFCTPVWHPRNPDVVFAVNGYAGSLRVSRDAGRSFQPVGTGISGVLTELAIDKKYPDTMLAASKEGHLFLSTDCGLNWEWRHFFNAPVSSLVFATPPNAPAAQAFLISANKLYASRDAGKTWQVIAKDLPQRPLTVLSAVVADGKTRLYLGMAAAEGAQGSGEIYRSDDAGATWRKISDVPLQPMPNPIHLRWLLVSSTNPDRVYAVGHLLNPRYAVYRSDDGAATWQPIFNGDVKDPERNAPDSHVSSYFIHNRDFSITLAAICDSDPDIMMVSDYCVEYITRDGGKTWFNMDVRHAPGQGKPAHGQRWINTGLNITTTWNYDISPHDGKHHYICATDLGFCRSDDAGKSWMFVREMGPNAYQVAFDPDVPGRMWGAFSLVHDIPNNNIVIGKHTCEGYGTVGRSDDFGATWHDLVAGMRMNDELWYGKGKNFDRNLPGRLPSVPIVSVILDPSSPRDARRLYATAFERGVYRSDDGARSWHLVGEGIGAPGVNVRVCRVTLQPDGALLCLVTGKMRNGKLMREGVGLFKLDAGATKWRDLTTALDIRWLTDFSVDPTNSNVIYLNVCDDPGYNKNEGGLYRSKDGGSSWEHVIRLGSRHFGTVFSPFAKGRIYTTLVQTDAHRITPGFSGGALWVSEDNGGTWRPFQDYPFHGAHRVHFDKNAPDTIYVTSFGGGVWKGPALP